MENMEYIKIPLRGKYGSGKFTIVDGDYDGEYFSGFKWYLSPNGYVIRSDIVDGKRTYIYLHNDVMPKKDGFWVDHIDRNKLNNRSCNLRYLTPQQSAHNRYYSDGRKTINIGMSEKEAKQIIKERILAIKERKASPEYKKRKAEYDRKRYLSKKSQDAKLLQRKDPHNRRS